ncbi:MAG: hypothetical protein ACI93T_001176 [Porticoccaceae bacterium]
MNCVRQSSAEAADENVIYKLKLPISTVLIGSFFVMTFVEKKHGQIWNSVTIMGRLAVAAVF